jgi:hypothetical protein
MTFTDKGEGFIHPESVIEGIYSIENTCCNTAEHPFFWLPPPPEFPTFTATIIVSTFNTIKLP